MLQNAHMHWEENVSTEFEKTYSDKSCYSREIFQLWIQRSVDFFQWQAIHFLQFKDKRCIFGGNGLEACMKLKNHDFCFQTYLVTPWCWFVCWMHLSYFICSFHSSLIGLMFRPSFSEIHAISNVRLLKQLSLADLCLSMSHSLGLGKYDTYLCYCLIFLSHAPHRSREFLVARLNFWMWKPWNPQEKLANSFPGSFCHFEHNVFVSIKLSIAHGNICCFWTST